MASWQLWRPIPRTEFRPLRAHDEGQKEGCCAEADLDESDGERADRMPFGDRGQRPGADGGDYAPC